MTERQQRKYDLSVEYDGVCCFCNKPVKVPTISGKPEGTLRSQVHHLRHRQFGGSDDYKNLRLACRKCHREYHWLFDKIANRHSGSRLLLKMLLINLLWSWWYRVKRIMFLQFVFSR